MLDDRRVRTGWLAGAWGFAALVASACILSGCSVELSSALSEVEANRIIVALNESGIAASKGPDPNAEGRFLVWIPRSDLGAGVSALERAGLPAERSPGVLDSLGESGLIASRQSEHARLVVGTAGELERTLRDVAGVLSARVHLAVKDADPLTPPEAQKPASASVLIRHRGTTPPLSTEEIQRLVAGAVAGLSEARVAVVQHAVPSPPETPAQGLVQLGPLSLSRSSLSSLRWMIAGAATLNVMLLGVLLLLWTRVRRMQQRDLTAIDSEGAS